MNGSVQLTRAAAGDGLSIAFQPIVSLPDECVIGYEALARWPAFDSVNPTSVIQRASELDIVDGFDRACIEGAVNAAVEALPEGSVLSINTEACTSPVTIRNNPLLASAAERYRIMFEITERSLLEKPAGPPRLDRFLSR